MQLLTSNEYEVMNLLWAEARPLSKSEIVELAVEKSWKPNSIHVLLNSLLKKEMIEVTGFVSTGKNYGRTFSPCITQEAYIAHMVLAGGQKPQMDAARLFNELSSCGVLAEGSIDALKAQLQG